MAGKTKSGKSHPDKHPFLDTEDAELWSRVTETAEPLSRGRNRATLREPDPALTARREKPVPVKSADSPAPSSEFPVPRRSSDQPPPLNSYDRREAKDLSRGRIDIDARIDLHGMRQREAHGALKSFLARARERGHRHVLVITGKGKPRSSLRAETHFTEGGGEPGVLRRNVPLWLDEPDIRQWVVGYTPAAPRHGGEGALYVRLRRSGSRDD